MITEREASNIKVMIEDGTSIPGVLVFLVVSRLLEANPFGEATPSQERIMHVVKHADADLQISMLEELK